MNFPEQKHFKKSLCLENYQRQIT